VQAVRGERATYQPLRSVLTHETRPGSVVDALLEFAPFPVLYIADLDAIMGNSSQSGLILELCAEHPEVEFWVDAGPSNDANTEGPENSRRVLGTEYADTWPQEGIFSIRSLDFNQDGLMGGQQIWDQPAQWPESIIAMCLHRVGSMNGPDWELLYRTRARQPERNWIAAGGIRGVEDLKALLDDGFDVLTASALHGGTLTREDVSILMAGTYTSP